MAIPKIKGVDGTSIPSNKLFTIKIAKPKSTTAVTGGFKIPKLDTKMFSGGQKAQDVLSEITGSGRTVNGLLKGTKPVMVGNSAYQQFLQYNKFGNVSTNMDLGDPELRAAVIQKAEADGKIPKGTLEALTSNPNDLGQNVTKGIMRFLNLLQMADLTELTVSNGYRTMVSPEIRTRIEGLKAGKTDAQINAELAIPRFFTRVFPPTSTIIGAIQLGKEAVVKWYNDLQATFGATGVRQEEFDPLALWMKDAVDLRDTLASLPNRTSDQDRELSQYNWTIDKLNTPTGNDWMKSQAVTWIPIVGPLLYPMFRTWGNVADIGLYTAGGVLGAKLAVPTVLSAAGKITGLNKGGSWFTTGWGDDFATAAAKSGLAINDLSEAKKWVAIADKTIDLETVTEANYKSMISTIVDKVARGSYSTPEVIAAEYITQPKRTLGSMSIKTAFTMKNLQSAAKKFMSGLGADITAGTRISQAGERILLNESATAILKGFQNEFIELVNEISKKMKETGAELMNAEQSAQVLIKNPTLRMMEKIKNNPLLYLENETKYMKPWGPDGQVKAALEAKAVEIFGYSPEKTPVQGLIDAFQVPLRVLTNELLGETGLVSGIFRRKFPIELDNIPLNVREWVLRTFNVDSARFAISSRYAGQIKHWISLLQAAETDTLRAKFFGQLMALAQKKGKGALKFLSFTGLTPEEIAVRTQLIEKYAFGLAWENKTSLRAFIKADAEAQKYIDLMGGFSGKRGIMEFVKKMQGDTGVVIEQMIKDYFPHVFFTEKGTPLVGAAIPRTYDSLAEALQSGVQFLSKPSDAYLGLFSQYQETAALGMIYDMALGQFLNTAHMIFGSPAIYKKIAKMPELYQKIIRISGEDDLVTTLNMGLSETEKAMAVKILTKSGFKSRIVKSTGLIKLMTITKDIQPQDYLRVQDVLRTTFPQLLGMFQASEKSNDRVYKLLLQYMLKDTGNEDVLINKNLAAINKKIEGANIKISHGNPNQPWGPNQRFLEPAEIEPKIKVEPTPEQELAKLKWRSSKLRGAINGLGDSQRRFLTLAYAVDMPLPRSGDKMFIGFESTRDLIRYGGVKGVYAFAANPRLMLTEAGNQLGLIDVNIPQVVNAMYDNSDMHKMGITNEGDLAVDEIDIQQIMGVEGITNAIKKRLSSIATRLYDKSSPSDRQLAIGSHVAALDGVDEYIKDRGLSPIFVGDVKLTRKGLQRLKTITGEERFSVLKASKNRKDVIPLNKKGRTTAGVYALPTLAKTVKVNSGALGTIDKLLKVEDYKAFKESGYALVEDMDTGEIRVVNEKLLLSKSKLETLFEQVRKEEIKTLEGNARQAQGIDSTARMATVNNSTVKRMGDMYESVVNGSKKIMVTYSAGLPIKSAVGNVFNDAFLFGGAGLRNFPEMMKILRLTIDYFNVAPLDENSSFINKIINKGLKVRRYAQDNALGNRGNLHSDPLYLSLSREGKEVVQLLENSSKNVQASLTNEYGKGFGSRFQKDLEDALFSTGADDYFFDKAGLPGVNNRIKVASKKLWNGVKQDPFGFAYLNTVGDFAHKISAAFKYVEKYTDPISRMEAFNKYFTRFADLSPLEQTLHRRIFQFYLWQRNNFMNYITAVFGDEPNVARSLALWGTAIRLSQDPDIQKAIDALPDGDYRKNLLWVGDKESYIMGMNTPFEGFYNFSRLIPFLDPGPETPLAKMQDTAKAYAENANVPISLAMALIYNQDVRTGRIIDPFADTSIKSTDKGYTLTSDVSRTIMLMLPKNIQDEFGFIKRQNPYTKATEYYMDPWLNYFISRNPVIVTNTLIPMIPLEDDSSAAKKDAFTLITNTLFGLRVRGVADYTMMQLLGEQSLNDKLGKLMTEAGLMNVIETPNMTPLQTYQNQLPQSVDQIQKAIEYLNSPLGLQEFNAMKKTASKATLKKTKKISSASLLPK